MRKQVILPPDESSPPLPISPDVPAPTPSSGATQQPPMRRTGGTSRRRLFRGRYLAGAGIVVAIILVITLLVVELGAPAKSGSTTATPSIKQVQVPTHTIYNAQAPVAPTGNEVTINLVVKETLLSIAPGVAYHAWTFNGTVPGPVLRVRQGQTIHFTLTNDGTLPHSMDFHAAQTPWNVNYQPIAPGKSFSFDWQASSPGVFLYHCGTPPVMDHMANGMYGAIIVDPINGWAPAQEYVLVQSEFYTAKAPDGSYYQDMSKMMSNTPDEVVFNGYANQYKDAPLQAKAGERVRLFLVNAGPSLFEAFHVIGAIFSDVYVDGNPANHLVGDQTVTVPPGGGAVVELTMPQAGLYPFVTHSFSAASIGATGVIQVTQ